MASRQRERQKEWRKKGLCMTCGRPAAPSTRKGSGGIGTYCLAHLEAKRERQREKLGCKRRFCSTSYKLRSGEIKGVQLNLFGDK